MGLRALYGKVALNKEFCQRCKQWAFVLEDRRNIARLQCCNRRLDANPEKWKRESVCGIGKRPAIPRRGREAIIQNQESRCLYCEHPFGTHILRMTSKRARRVFGANVSVTPHRIFLRAVIDHMVPWSYHGHHDYKNLAAACQVCNGIKSSRMFATVEEARVYIGIQKERKGYI